MNFRKALKFSFLHRVFIVCGRTRLGGSPVGSKGFDKNSKLVARSSYIRPEVSSLKKKKIVKVVITCRPSPSGHRVYLRRSVSIPRERIFPSVSSNLHNIVRVLL
jgi:hypothetical protein